MSALTREQAETVARAIAYGLQDSLRETPSPAPIKLYNLSTTAYGESVTIPSTKVNPLENGGAINFFVFNTGLAERNAIVEAIHRLNRKGLIKNEHVDLAIGAGYAELKTLHYPSTIPHAEPEDKVDADKR
jgi:Tfp pilus assembly PilM family ATPase